MAKLGAAILIALSLGFAVDAQTQNLDMSASDQSSTFDQAGKPTRGMTQQSVEASFGSPQNARQAIGEPPITRWEYANFVVFFEYDKVIHAVTKR
jgi:hypothetical protein